MPSSVAKEWPEMDSASLPCSMVIISTTHFNKVRQPPQNSRTSKNTSLSYLVVGTAVAVFIFCAIRLH
ncbi:hypothetical protein AOLI_G00193400 [Acnodon oligacanthus]